MEVSYYQLDYNAMRHNGRVMKCNWHGYVINMDTFCLRLSFFMEGKGSWGKVMGRKLLLWPVLCPGSGLSSPVPAAPREAGSRPSPLTLDQLDALGGRGELRTRARESKWLRYPHCGLWKLLEVSAAWGWHAWCQSCPDLGKLFNGTSGHGFSSELLLKPDTCFGPGEQPPSLIMCCLFLDLFFLIVPLSWERESFFLY